MGRGRILLGGLLAVLLPFPQVALADTVSITMGTAVLAGTAGTLAFDFIDGDGTADNTVSLLQFSSDGTFDPATAMGGVTGDLQGGAVFTDSDFLNQLLAPAVFGNSIAFTLSFTNVAGDPPDTFSVFLLDNAAIASLVTTELPASALLQITLDGTGSAFVLARSVEPAVTVAPEPSSLALLLLGLAALAPLATR